jgi:phenylacetate-CoA ligase
METKVARFIYDHSPPVLQDVYASVFGLKKRLARFTSAYDFWFDFYRKALSWSRPELEAYQREQLQYTIRNAYETTPFYRRRFDEHGLTPDDIRDIDDLAELPYLEKDEIRLHSEEMISNRYPRKDFSWSPTGGTTGMALRIFTPRQVLPRHYAFHWSRVRIPVRRGDPYASFTGLQIVRPERARPPFWRRNVAAHQTAYSVFHLKPEFMDAYLDDLNGHRITWWEGYPGAMFILAEYLEESGRPFWNFPKHIFPTSEQLQPHYRETLERALKARVWDEYGQGEMAGRITEYPCGHLHYDMDYSVLEFLPVGKENGEEVYELICTGFFNDGWPMIRYRVGDLVTLDPDVRCDYHAGPIVKTIYGRTGHVIVTPDGHRISNISVITKKCRQGVKTLRRRREAREDRCAAARAVLARCGVLRPGPHRLLAFGVLTFAVCHARVVRPSILRHVGGRHGHALLRVRPSPRTTRPSGHHAHGADAP